VKANPEFRLVAQNLPVQKQVWRQTIGRNFFRINLNSMSQLSQLLPVNAVLPKGCRQQMTFNMDPPVVLVGDLLNEKGKQGRNDVHSHVNDFASLAFNQTLPQIPLQRQLGQFRRSDEKLLQLGLHEKPHPLNLDPPL
jgi:hypothetical protein